MLELEDIPQGGHARLAKELASSRKRRRESVNTIGAINGLLSEAGGFSAENIKTLDSMARRIKGFAAPCEVFKKGYTYNCINLDTMEVQLPDNIEGLLDEKLKRKGKKNL